MAPTSTAPLPREIEADADVEAIRVCLAAPGRRLWAGGALEVSVLPLAPSLVRALETAAGTQQLVVGLEGAAEALARDERGLAALARRAGGAGGPRISRLLLLSEDGAERHYRQAERLAERHAPRVLVVLLACDALALGRAVAGREMHVKAVLAAHKQVAAALLRAACLWRRTPG